VFETWKVVYCLASIADHGWVSLDWRGETARKSCRESLSSTESRTRPNSRRTESRVPKYRKVSQVSGAWRGGTLQRETLYISPEPICHRPRGSLVDCFRTNPVQIQAIKRTAIVFRKYLPVATENNRWSWSRVVASSKVQRGDGRGFWRTKELDCIKWWGKLIAETKDTEYGTRTKATKIGTFNPRWDDACRTKSGPSLECRLEVKACQAHRRVELDEGNFKSVDSGGPRRIWKGKRQPDPNHTKSKGAAQY
jgi:hypothetical protein